MFGILQFHCHGCIKEVTGLDDFPGERRLKEEDLEDPR
jgi:hypothetical protein